MSTKVSRNGNERQLETSNIQNNKAEQFPELM